MRAVQECAAEQCGCWEIVTNHQGIAIENCSLPSIVDIVGFMYRDFYALDRWTKKQAHCLYQALIVAIATRHADAVDIKFLVDGRPVWVALALAAWDEYKKRTGKTITD